MQETLDVMSKNGVRRVPVINKEGKLVGLISLDDLLINLIEKLNSLSMVLKKQIA